jgi:uncharacterized protein YegL
MSKDFTQVTYGTSPDTQPFGFADDFADNPEPRCPCVLLLDTSGSMHGERIDQLNAGIAAFKQELMTDSLAVKRVEISIVTFGPVHQRNTFQTADVFHAPQLSTTGDTPMGAAILEALRIVEERKRDYQLAGVAYYRPWIFMITDGGPTDEWQTASRQLKEAVSAKKLAFFAVAVQGADIERLTQISPRKPLILKGLMFRELFSWLSNSLGAVSRSSPSQERLLLPPPSSDWSEL